MSKDKTGSTAYRIITAVFGAFFLGVAIAITVVSDRSVGSLLAAAVIGLMGADAMFNAWRNRPSLLSRLGPLP